MGFLIKNFIFNEPFFLHLLNIKTKFNLVMLKIIFIEKVYLSNFMFELHFIWKI